MWRKRIKKMKKTKLFGVDISEMNGDVDFSALKKAGVKFVMIRAGFGNDDTSQDDLCFFQNVRRAELNNIPWGAYLFSYALSKFEIESEVKHIDRLLSQARDNGYYPTYPIALDIERSDHVVDNGGWCYANIARNIRVYMTEMSALGYYPMIYSGYEVRDNFTPEMFKDNSLWWFAQWAKTPANFSGDTNLLGIWQYGGAVPTPDPT